MLAATGLLTAQGQAPAAQRIAAHLRPNDLKADVSFLASDALQGRATPSPGLDMAAEYIAAQFRRAGLEPVGDDGYFQNASYQSVKPNPEGLEFTLDDVKAEPGTVAIQEAVATDLHRAAAFKVMLSDAAALDALTVDRRARQGPAGGSARWRGWRPREHGWISGAAKDRDAGWKTGSGDGGDGARRRTAGQSECPRADARRHGAGAQGADSQRVGQGDSRCGRRREARAVGSDRIGARRGARRCSP